MDEVRILSALVDINVLLDVYLEREPWVADARAIWAAHHEGRFTGHVAAHGLTNLFYVARKLVGVEKARGAVRICLETFEVVAVGRDELQEAHDRAGSDLEDDLVVACAVRAGLDAIVTRDLKGFASSPVAAMAPAEFLGHLAGKAGS